MMTYKVGELARDYCPACQTSRPYHVLEQSAQARRDDISYQYWHLRCRCLSCGEDIEIDWAEDINRERSEAAYQEQAASVPTFTYTPPSGPVGKHCIDCAYYCLPKGECQADPPYSRRQPFSNACEWFKDKQGRAAAETDGDER